MSRALNPKVIEALKAGDHNQVFDEIASILTYDASSPARLEIEILSGFGFDPSVNVLRTENAVAIPKLRLVQGFFVARALLQKHAAGIPQEAQARREVRRASAVCLMMDAENLTAANTRKRLLAAEIQNATGEALQELLWGEKWLLDSILTSWLHRHTKSPTLWSHRRWLLGQFTAHGLASEIHAADEIACVIGPAGEQHPRNYYAWNHARGIVTGFPGTAAGELVEVCKKWAWKHHGDVSGWSFLLFVLRQQEQQQQQQQRGETSSLTGSVVSETIGLAESLQWRNESVWWFLWTVVAERGIEDERKRVVTLGEKLFEDAKRENSRDEKAVWERARKRLSRWG
ncbi:hypothetical protein TD95_003896 [Thielaviopsis punctulata]|uniref:Uncharacterized protein n=1 Tax=Thielaviopsis punctulata TaxID=72032 RepID=A0A0F4ZCF0_9PEZI|nr:hypothetical protein TD95_004824 [Thielaviopsis punctulata]KKA27801.1 hypothetical protein TD95_003896 [Thielaviopsis punctulata]